MQSINQVIDTYRQLNDHEIALMKKIKDKGQDLAALCDELMARPNLPAYPNDVLASGTSTDKRWVATGKTQLQQGIMLLVRSVAQHRGF